MINLFRNTILLLVSSYFVAYTAFAQTYGNEWIKYNQKYYSFKVAPGVIPNAFNDMSNIETGLYKIDYNTLINSGIDPTAFNSEDIQVFGREKEVPLLIEDGGDNSIDPGDYILFYTKRNDGWQDSSLYSNPTDIGNPFYSLYNDTLKYFFTWDTTTTHLRYTIETDTDFSSYTPASYVWYERYQGHKHQYQEGEGISQNSSSFFMHGEGYSNGKANGATSGYTWNYSGTNFYNPYQAAGAPDMIVTGMHLGLSDASTPPPGGPNHHVRYSIGPSNYVYMDTTWYGYATINISTTIPMSILPASGGSNLKAEIIPDLGATTDYQSLPFWHFKYPRVPIFNYQPKLEFEVENSTLASKIRIDIDNISYGSSLAFIHGETPRVVPLISGGGVYSALIPNSVSGANQKVFYQDTSTATYVATMTPVGNSGSFTDFTAEDLESALIMVSHPNLATASDNYQTYRESFAGGNYNVVRANVTELYDQFGGGVDKHVNGIRRFAHFVYNNSTQKPVGLFLMGKGIKEATIGADQGARNNATYYNESLIPSFGQPSSDICITAGLEGSYEWAPLMATGRISARSNQELQDYLDKIIQHESNQDPMSVYDSPNKDWQKQILHFTGGSDLIQQNQFQSYMNGMEYIIEDSLYGGNVTRVYKEDSNPLNPAILQTVTDRISKGVSLMNYFGHASSTTSGFEINLDDPSNWNNTGKYPLMLVNSCYNGNLFLYENSRSEDFVQIPQEGAIGYIASTNVGWDSPLYQYSLKLYRQFSYISYGATVGEQMKRNIELLEPTWISNSLHYETTCTQMLLNGDPMMRLNWHERPEIELLPEYVWFTPENLDLTVDSIEMHINLKNLGMSVTDTFALEVIRDFPNATADSVYLFEFPNLHYVDSFSFKMPMQPNIGLGLNAFEISVDIPSVIDEQYEEIFNNQITKTLLIDVDGIIPVEPYNYAVVPIDSVTVKASTNNPIAGFNTYRFELDTIDFVGAPSPFHRYAIVSGLGGVKEVNPSEWTMTSGGSGTLVCEDSVVYFWRVQIDGDSIWREHSFQYIPGKEGWGQDHFYQFKNNGFNGVNYNRPARLREFSTNQKELQVDVFNSIWDAAGNAYYIDGIQQEYAICTGAPSFYCAVIDPITLEPWGTRIINPPNGPANLDHAFGNVNDDTGCRTRVEKYFVYRQGTAAQLAAFKTFVMDSVPDGHYLLIYTPIRADYSEWDALDPTVYNVFQTLGSDSIYPGRPELPFAFFCKKGDTSTVVEYCSQSITDDFTINAMLEGTPGIGRETSPLIGPVANWKNVYWKQDPMEFPSQDTTILTINAYDWAGNFQTSIDTAFTADDSLLNLNNLIDANLYPYITLSAYYVDTTDATPSQIDRWHVLFDPLPEAAIDGSTLYTWSAGATSTVSEGEEIDFAVDVKNIFTVDMDSLLINYWVEDENHIPHYITYARQDSLRVGETLRDTVTFSTAGLVGINSLWMEVNPYIAGSLVITDQPEQKHFNNLLQVPFYVNPDSINPILDVTFDGNHILNGDIVSPNSEILITLKDENDFLIMDDISDTTLFGVYITDPSGVLTKIPFVDALGNTIMYWEGATSSDKKFKITWPAEFNKDGVYTLLVQGSDRAGNISGDIEYRVNFEIIHESTITKMMNYPNPFSTSTRFVFTLTGSEVPDEIIIQIMTVTGRVVREITEDQIGQIYIGRNITEYAWDGTDEFGDPLANGVYLYRVKAQINGENIKQRESGADRYFEKDFGKMYILR